MKKILLIHRSLGLGGAEKIFAFVANSLSEKFEVKILLLTESNITLKLNSSIHVSTNSCYVDRPILGKKIYQGFNELKHMSDIILTEISNYSPELIICFDLRIILAIALRRKRISAKILFSERADPYENPKYWAVILKYIYRKVDNIVFQTEQARKFYGSIVKGKSCVLPNPAFARVGIEVNKDNIRREDIIFAAGRFQYRKGFDLLIRAFANIKNEFPSCKMIIFGNGEEQDNLKKLIEEHKLENIVEIREPINGVVEKNRTAKLFVIPSRSEGIPNILIEAMMEGIPCVTTDCSPGGARMLSEEGKYCLLAKNNDVKSLSDNIRYALNNPKHMEAMAIEAKQSMSRFEPEYIGNKWIEVVKNMI